MWWRKKHLRAEQTHERHATVWPVAWPVVSRHSLDALLDCRHVSPASASATGASFLDCTEPQKHKQTWRQRNDMMHMCSKLNQAKVPEERGRLCRHGTGREVTKVPIYITYQSAYLQTGASTQTQARRRGCTQAYAQARRHRRCVQCHAICTRSEGAHRASVVACLCLCTRHLLPVTTECHPLHDGTRAHTCKTH